MLWDDGELTKKKHAQLRVLPSIPFTGWKPPTYYPNLSAASVISFDVETKETDFEYGPGWARGRSSIIGFSIAARSGNETGKWYYPIRHAVGSEWNLDPNAALRWLDSVLNTPHIPKVGANLLYDIGSLGEDNVRVAGKLHDVQFAEALIDEEAFVSLDTLAAKYLRRNKTAQELYQWLADAYGGAPSPKQRENIWRAPPELVGPYGEDDADLPLRVMEAQFPALEAQSLIPVFELENRLIPLLIKMRRQGVKVDIPRAEQLRDKLSLDIQTLYAKLHADTGVHVNINSPLELAKLFDLVGIEYPRTADGNPSFRKEFMKDLKHPIADQVNNIREHIKCKSTFLEGYILQSNIKGKLFCQFHPLKGDDNGAKTGRFASSDPNLQNIPVRTELGKQLRTLFTPFIGHLRWRKFDYSQIEYRMLAHYAINELGGNSADRLRQSYIENPDQDYHDLVQAMVKQLTSILIDRRPLKNINFGLLYGQSQKALAYKAGFSGAQSDAVFKAYHDGAPYVKATMKDISKHVQRFGYIDTILGRRTRFNLWKPPWPRKGFPMNYHAALAEYGSDIERADDYKATNYRMQGSAADVIKKAMDTANQSGVFDVIGYPTLQVHDELDFSEIDESPQQTEAYSFLTHTLETSLKCRVPIKVDTKFGDNWGVID